MFRCSLLLCSYSVGILVFSLISPSIAQYETAAGLLQFGKFLKDVAYPGLMEWLSDNKSWEAFGIPCNYHRKAGFHSWQLKYTGKITCSGLGEWKRDKCKSKGCAFKEPMKQYLTALARRGVATKEQLVQHIQGCDCGFSAGDKQEMINSINQA